MEFYQKAPATHIKDVRQDNVMANVYYYQDKDDMPSTSHTANIYIYLSHFMFALAICIGAVHPFGRECDVGSFVACLIMFLLGPPPGVVLMF
eukprot:2097551-Amphidinium_carterae.2